MAMRGTSAYIIHGSEYEMSVEDGLDWDKGARDGSLQGLRAAALRKYVGRQKKGGIRLKFWAAP